MSDLTDARESLEILEDTLRFLIEDVGKSGELTLSNSFCWADQVRQAIPFCSLRG